MYPTYVYSTVKYILWPCRLLKIEGLPRTLGRGCLWLPVNIINLRNRLFLGNVTRNKKTKTTSSSFNENESLRKSHHNIVTVTKSVTIIIDHPLVSSLKFCRVYTIGGSRLRPIPIFWASPIPSVTESPVVTSTSPFPVRTFRWTEGFKLQVFLNPFLDVKEIRYWWSNNVTISTE